MKKLVLLVVLVSLAFLSTPNADELISPVPHNVQELLDEEIKLEKYNLIDDRLVLIEKVVIETNKKEKKEISLYIGRGVILDSNGLILTAGHVVSKNDAIKVKRIYVRGLNFKKTITPVHVIIHPTKDLAIIRIKPIDEIKVNKLLMSNKDKVKKYGLFLPIYDEYKSFDLRKDVKTGQLAGFSTEKVVDLGKKKTQHLMATTIIIKKGYSGSAIYDKYNNLAGIIVSIDTMSKFGSAIGLKDLEDGLKDLLKMEEKLLKK